MRNYSHCDCTAECPMSLCISLSSLFLSLSLHDLSGVPHKTRRISQCTLHTPHRLETRKSIYVSQISWQRRWDSVFWAKSSTAYIYVRMNNTCHRQDDDFLEVEFSDGFRIVPKVAFLKDWVRNDAIQSRVARLVFSTPKVTTNVAFFYSVGLEIVTSLSSGWPKEVYKVQNFSFF